MEPGAPRSQRKLTAKVGQGCDQKWSPEVPLPPMVTSACPEMNEFSGSPSLLRAVKVTLVTSWVPSRGAGEWKAARLPSKAAFQLVLPSYPDPDRRSSPSGPRASASAGERGLGAAGAGREAGGGGRVRAGGSRVGSMPWRARTPAPGCGTRSHAHSALRAPRGPPRPTRCVRGCGVRRPGLSPAPRAGAALVPAVRAAACAPSPARGEEPGLHESCDRGRGCGEGGQPRSPAPPPGQRGA